VEAGNICRQRIGSRAIAENQNVGYDSLHDEPEIETCRRLGPEELQEGGRLIFFPTLKARNLLKTQESD
jgi:hypothetical protein